MEMNNKRAAVTLPRLITFFTAFMLSSCVGAVQMLTTPTPTPEERDEINESLPLTPIPSSTATQTPTATMVPLETQSQSPIATARKILRLGTETSLDEAGFTFRAPLGYLENYQYGQVTLTSEDGDTVLSLIGGKALGSEDIENNLKSFVELISDSENFRELNISTPYEFNVEEALGLATDVDGMWGQSPISGRIVVVSPQEEQIFYALAISSKDPSGSGWEPEGRQAFEAVLNSVTFFAPTEPQQ